MHTVRHVLEHCLLIEQVFKTDRVADVLAERDVHFLRHALGHGHGGHTTRLKRDENEEKRKSFLNDVNSR
jgi:hypothetical protein